MHQYIYNCIPLIFFFCNLSVITNPEVYLQLIFNIYTVSLIIILTLIKMKDPNPHGLLNIFDLILIVMSILMLDNKHGITIVPITILITCIFRLIILIFIYTVRLGIKIN